MTIPSNTTPTARGLDDETEAALRSAICASPHDDAPRLVLATWLEERGNPYGELIALQCALAQLAPDDPRGAALGARESMLWKLHPTWRAPRQGILASNFVRGFPTRVRVDRLRVDRRQAAFAEVRRYAATLPDATVQLDATTLDLDELEASLSSFHRLHLVIRPEDTARVAGWKSAVVQELDLREFATNDVVRLAAFRNLPLETLVVSGKSPSFLEALGASPILGKIHELHVSVRRPDEVEAVSTIVSWPCHQLCRLSLGLDRALGESGRALRGMVTAPFVEQLDTLGFRIEAMDRVAVEALTQSNLSQLKRFSIGYDRGWSRPPKLLDDAVGALFEWPTLWQLEELSLRCLSAAPPRFDARRVWDRLERLHAPHNRFDDDTAKALCRAAPALRHLDLSGNPIGPAGARSILDRADRTPLVTLSLSRTHVGSDSSWLETAASRSGVRRLRKLELEGVHVAIPLRRRLLRCEAPALAAAARGMLAATSLPAPIDPERERRIRDVAKKSKTGKLAWRHFVAVGLVPKPDAIPAIACRPSCKSPCGACGGSGVVFGGQGEDVCYPCRGSGFAFDELKPGRPEPAARDHACRLAARAPQLATVFDACAALRAAIDPWQATPRLTPVFSFDFDEPTFHLRRPFGLFERIAKALDQALPKFPRCGELPGVRAWSAAGHAHWIDARDEGVELAGDRDPFEPLVRLCAVGFLPFRLGAEELDLLVETTDQAP